MLGIVSSMWDKNYGKKKTNLENFWTTKKVAQSLKASRNQKNLVVFSFRDWYLHFQGVFSRSEISLSPGMQSGIEPIMVKYYSQCFHRFAGSISILLISCHTTIRHMWALFGNQTKDFAHHFSRSIKINSKKGPCYAKDIPGKICVAWPDFRVSL